MRRPPLASLVVAVALAAGCRDAARAVAPPEPAPAGADGGARLDLAGPAAALPVLAALGDVQAATSDARDRILPTLADAPARIALAGALDRLDLALVAGDLPGTAAAVAGARTAVDDARAAGLDAPAELDVIALALDRTDALLAPALP